MRRSAAAAGAGLAIRHSRAGCNPAWKCRGPAPDPRLRGDDGERRAGRRLRTFLHGCFALTASTYVRKARLPRYRLPAEDRFPHEGRPPPEGAGHCRTLGIGRAVSAAARGARRPREVHLPRWSALRQWRHAYRPCAEPHAEGHGLPHAEPAGQKRALCSGLGLPRPADRVEGRGTVPQEEAGQESGPGEGIPRRMPRLCAALGRCAARTAEAAGHHGGLGLSLSDHAVRQRGDHRGRADEICRSGQPLSRFQAGDVEPGRRNRAGRSRGRIRGHHQHADRCRVRNHRKPDQGTGRRACGDLDHNALDDPGQPGFGLRTGDRVRSL